jgi:hypothetical protein
VDEIRRAGAVGDCRRHRQPLLRVSATFRQECLTPRISPHILHAWVVGQILPPPRGLDPLTRQIPTSLQRHDVRMAAATIGFPAAWRPILVQVLDVEAFNETAFGQRMIQIELGLAEWPEPDAKRHHFIPQFMLNRFGRKRICQLEKATGKPQSILRRRGGLPTPPLPVRRRPMATNRALWRGLSQWPRRRRRPPCFASKKMARSPIAERAAIRKHQINLAPLRPPDQKLDPGRRREARMVRQGARVAVPRGSPSVYAAAGISSSGSAVSLI